MDHDEARSVVRSKLENVIKEIKKEKANLSYIIYPSQKQLSFGYETYKEYEAKHSETWELTGTDDW